MRMSLAENFLQSVYPESSLPPLWDVIYQEAMRGHHLLFRKSDLERYADTTVAQDFDDNLSDELEIIVLKLIGCSDLQAMVKIVDALGDEHRRNLYAFYRRVLWMWQHYVKGRLN